LIEFEMNRGKDTWIA